MAIMSDKKSNGPQFSKIIVLLCVIIGILGISATIAISIIFGLSEALSAATIGVFGCVFTTAVIFYLKKSQSENTVRMYVEAYKEIAEIKGDNSILEGLGDNLVDKMTCSLDSTLEDGTSLIERVDV